jgi:tetratricopeptide (TPR) repeat protein
MRSSERNRKSEARTAKPPSGAAPRRHGFRDTRLLTILAAGLFWGNCSAGQPNLQTGADAAFAALRAGDYPRARASFEAALKRNPADERIQAGLLATLSEAGAYQEALQLADGLLSNRVGSPRLLLEQGRILLAVGRYADCDRSLQAARSMLQNSSGTLAAAVERELAGLAECTGRAREATGFWEAVMSRLRRGELADSEGLGHAAVAAWRMGSVADAKDIFMDAADTGKNSEVSLTALSDFGYLFLEKYNATDAMGCFRDCLAINAAYAPALLGIALAKKYESSAEVESYSSAALKANPNFVPALNLRAGLRYQEEDYDAGLAEVRRALAVNPNDLGALSLEAVYCQARGNGTRFREVEDAIRRINPSFGRLYGSLAEDLVMRRKYAEAVEQYRKAVALDPGLWSAYAGLGINLMRTGDLAGGRKMLDRAFEGDPFNVWAFNTLDLLDQMDKFITFQDRNFIFLMSREDEPVLKPYLSRLADEAYRSLTRRYGFTPEGKIQVEVFPDHGGFAVRTLGLPGLGALGVCFGRVVAMDSPRAQKVGTFNWGSTFWHEFAHVITLQMSRHNIPRWYSEGLSVVEERRARPGWGDDLTAGFIRAYKDGRLLKAGDLNAGFLRPKYAEQIENTYYQASLFCEMVEEKFGFGKIRDSLQLFAEGRQSEEVFRSTLGWDPATMESEYAAYLDRTLRERASHLRFSGPERSQTTRTKPPGKAELMRALESDPNDFFACLHLGRLLVQEGAPQAAEPYLKKAQSLFPEYVEPGNPYQELSELYLRTEREDEALAEFLGWVRFDEQASRPLIRAAEIFRKRKAWKEEAELLERSIYANPFQAEAHRMLAEAASESGDWITAVMGYQAIVGLNPPDLAGAYYNLARAWLSGGNRQEARRAILRCLEIAPAFEKAQQLLLKLREMEQP